MSTAAPSPTATYGTVEHVEDLSPSMRRVVLGGPGLDAFEPTPFTDQYVNALFVPDGAPYDVPFDVEEVRSLDGDHKPRGRRYTVRRWDPDTRQLTLDFVVHGDVGYAGRWARHAEPGDRLQVIGPSGGYAPRPDAPWHLMAGDESALPAIAASIESLPDDAVVAVFVVVDSTDHEIELPATSATAIHWLHRNTATTPEDLLVDTIRSFEFPDGHPHVFVHGEAGETRAVRRHLLGERGIDKASSSISPYWRRDHTDEAWREIKKAWLAEQETDVA